MKSIAIGVLALQVIFLIVLSVAVLWMYGQAIMAGAGFDSRFFTTQMWRLVAFLAPYLALPASIIISIVLLKMRRHRKAIWMPLLFIAVVSLAGQAYLRVVPDPIEDNFGVRSQPYSGFLVVSADSIPEGFVEKEHRYTKREYHIDYIKMVDGQKMELSIVEGDNIMFGNALSEPVQSFEYQGVEGHVYLYRHKVTQVVSYNLIWLNPPKQRISIYLTQTPNNDYTPDDLIKVLKGMKVAP